MLIWLKDQGKVRYRTFQLRFGRLPSDSSGLALESAATGERAACFQPVGVAEALLKILDALAVAPRAMFSVSELAEPASPIIGIKS